MTNQRIDHYSIMITTKYFESIDDFINLELAVKRFNGNMQRFHFNPIPLNDTSRKYFTNLETLHVYDESDQLFDDGRIFKQCIWYEVDYQRNLKEKENGNDCKLICYTQHDRMNHGNEIPKEVKILGKHCFDGLWDLSCIVIPTCIKELGYECFNRCQKLKHISIPHSVTKINKKCFYNCFSIESLSIESSFPKIEDYCFYNCTSLKSIEIPSSVEYIGKYCFSGCKSLSRISLPSTIKKLEENCFENCNSLKLVEINLMDHQKNKLCTCSMKDLMLSLRAIRILSKKEKNKNDNNL